MKHYNDLLDRQSFERGKDDVSFLCNTQSLELFPRNLREDFFLKIGILSPKVYIKNIPNVEVWNFILVLLRAQPFKQAIEVLYL